MCFLYFPKSSMLVDLGDLRKGYEAFGLTLVPPSDLGLQFSGSNVTYERLTDGLWLARGETFNGTDEWLTIEVEYLTFGPED